MTALPAPPAPLRRGATQVAGRWVLSLVLGGVLLWWSSTRIELWPRAWAFPAPWALVTALALHVPYALVRAARLSYVLDPLVGRAAGSRFDRYALYGSGFVSFFVLLVLPLKLGELSRPLLLAKARQPGVGLSAALGAVAVERILDGLLIVALLFAGLELAEVRSLALVDEVRSAGYLAGAAFFGGIAFLGWLAGAPAERARTLCRPLGGWRIAPRVAVAVTRAGEAAQVLRTWRLSLPLCVTTCLYWAITIAQLWCIQRACGLELGASQAATLVAIVGLSIQLPGGPAQAGTFQLGAAVGLGLFVDPTVLRTAGSQFAATLYLMGFAGAAVFAVPGWWLLKRSSSSPPASESGPPGDG